MIKNLTILVLFLSTSFLGLKLMQAEGEAMPVNPSVSSSGSAAHVQGPSPSCPHGMKDYLPRKLGFTGAELLNRIKESTTSSSSQKMRMSLGSLTANANSLFYDNFMKLVGPQFLGSCEQRVCAPERSTVSRLTKDVNVLKHVHSHNDYWRSLPLFEALSYGVSSVEADVWLVQNNTELAVGHNEGFLEAEVRNLETLYTGPLLSMLDEVNCHDWDSDEKYGVFYNSPETTLYLYIDFKSEDNIRTYDLLLTKYLKPLIDSGYLSYFDLETNSVIWNPITIVLTGDYPQNTTVLDHGNQDGYFHSMQRFAFLDAPLHKLDQVDATLSVVASCSLEQLLESCSFSDPYAQQRSELSREQLECMWPTIKQAHELNLKTRLWGVPDWPRYKRDNLWKQQLEYLQMDFLNVDDLAAISKF